MPSKISEEMESTKSSSNEKVEQAPFKAVEEGLSSEKCLCHYAAYEEETEEEGLDVFAVREEELRKELEERLESKITRMKMRFDLILQNEQVRTSYLLREAFRERQERINSLKTQLECKNLAALMFLLCSERRKKRHEIMEIIEEYTKHVKFLTDIICEGQGIIEDMILGFKSAAKVDEEWRRKTQKLIHEFQMFIEHYFGTNPDSSKFFFNLPELLKICAPLEPCPCLEKDESDISHLCEEIKTDPEADTWWYKLKSADKPFVVFGDMADFHPQKRRDVLNYLKENKQDPPEKWKEYAFNNKFLQAECPNLDAVRRKYIKYVDREDKFYCEFSNSMNTPQPVSMTHDMIFMGEYPCMATGGSTDYGCIHMGSILKMIKESSAHPVQRIVNKASILGAKDSLELMSSTKLLEKKEKKKADLAAETKSSLISDELYSLNLKYSKKNRRTSIAPDVESRIATYREYKEITRSLGSDSSDISVHSKLASIHRDSMILLDSSNFNQSVGDRIRYQKECPVKACERKYVNSLLRNLPPYMDIRNPYVEYERTFDNYEPCTQEELEKVISLNPGIERPTKNQLKNDTVSLDGMPELSQQQGGTGVAVQTSAIGLCQCHLVTSCQCSKILESFAEPPEVCLKKQDVISSSELYNYDIKFDRFKVIGEHNKNAVEKPKDFKTNRAASIMRILKNHPSLYSMFQATTSIG